MEHERVTRTVIGAAFRVFSILGPGFLESVYRNALVIELRRRRLLVESERRLRVRYGDEVVGDFVADLLVEGCVIAELKAVDALGRAHEAQLVNYLVATGIEVGVLLNFGAPRVEVRRRTRSIVARNGKRRTALQDDGGTTAG